MDSTNSFFGLDSNGGNRISLRFTWRQWDMSEGNIVMIVCHVSLGCGVLLPSVVVVVGSLHLSCFVATTVGHFCKRLFGK